MRHVSQSKRHCISCGFTASMEDHHIFEQHQVMQRPSTLPTYDSHVLAPLDLEYLHRLLQAYDSLTMLPSWVSTVSSIGMAVGPPLVYADQAMSIVKKRDSTGFSRDVCAILLTANITRCFFWMGKHFEMALLLQSILMILAQLALLYICIRYRPRTSPENYGASTRPFSFWQWTSYAQYVEFLAGFILCSAILYLIFGRSELYISVLGFVALGLESTLPIPQLISNFKQKSLYGFRASTLIGWVGGDSFKTAYFFAQGSPLQFEVCAIFQLTVDIIIVAQRFYYGNVSPPTALVEEEDLEQALALAEE